MTPAGIRVMFPDGVFFDAPTAASVLAMIGRGYPEADGLSDPAELADLARAGLTRYSEVVEGADSLVGMEDVPDDEFLLAAERAGLCQVVWLPGTVEPGAHRTPTPK